MEFSKYARLKDHIFFSREKKCKKGIHNLFAKLKKYHARRIQPVLISPKQM